MNKLHHHVTVQSGVVMPWFSSLDVNRAYANFMTVLFVVNQMNGETSTILDGQCLLG